MIARSTTDAKSSAAKKLNRSRVIAQVLVRHGLTYLVTISGLDRFVPFHTRLAARGGSTEVAAEHLRLALEELGTTSIKLGQVLSTRADLLPPAYQTELTKLQDRTPAVPSSQIHSVIVEELGVVAADAFATFSDEPLAAASIGQVHAATLEDGTAVVVKVRRPGVEALVEDDLALLRDLAAVAARRSRLGERYDLPELAEEFSQTLRSELDYLQEARNAERFAEMFAADPAIHIPTVYRQTTTARVLTLERIEGIKIDDVAALDAAGIDRTQVAARVTHMILTMVFEHGFFHADLHPGNFFVETGGRIGLIDFGMVGSLTQRTRERLVDLLLAITARDADSLVDAFLDLGTVHAWVDRNRLRDDLDALLARYADRPLGEITIGPLIVEAQAIVRRHHLHLPSDLALLLKAVVMSEGMGLRLDPSFQLMDAITPFAERMMLQVYSPVRMARKLAAAGLDAARLGVDLPKQLRRILNDLEQGRLSMTIQPAGMEPLFSRLERLVNRVVLGVIAAAFVVGLATLMSAFSPLDDDRWIGGFFSVGFLAAVALGVYLAWSILRSSDR